MNRNCARRHYMITIVLKAVQIEADTIIRITKLS